ncbi:hypothetical protein [Halorubellus litoreus]|uniref:Uncharacterized protein n=1 Tax=Halorubellus litoreus TaxID=755308 RepID=A0ABD5VNG9_9EURY
MSLHCATPIVHRTNSNYGDYYDSQDNCYFELSNHFDTNGCTGLCIGTNSSFSASDPQGSPTELYAVTSGYLSYRKPTNGPRKLVLRLPLELVQLSAHNSGEQYLDLSPSGPNLRHVVYELDTQQSTDTVVRAYIGSLLQQTSHPVREWTRVFEGEDVPARAIGRTPTVGEYLSNPPSSVSDPVGAVLDGFIDGEFELLVTAGDPISSFDSSVNIVFRDSSYTRNQDATDDEPNEPVGRPLNPSYFLYQLLGPNATGTNPVVDLQTAVDRSSNPSLAQTHPLLTILTGQTAQQESYVPLDLDADQPPPPRHRTITTSTNGGALAVGSLRNWHQSLHDPTTTANAEWQIVADPAQSSDDMGKLLVRDSASGNDIDVEYGSSGARRKSVEVYWNRYGELINAVAEAFRLPCESILAIACKESASLLWYDPNNFADSDEMNTVRLEPLDAGTAATQRLLNDPNDGHYGQLYDNLTSSNGANENIPVPWEGSQVIHATSSGNNLTWDVLVRLINNYDAVLASPGVTQTLVSTADGVLNWVDSMYGNDFVSNISATVDHDGNSVTLSVKNPGNIQNTLEDWFGAIADANGNSPPNPPYSANEELSKKQRAFHGFVIGGAYIRRTYNYTTGGGQNRIVDYDPPTIASAYNDRLQPDANTRYGMVMHQNYVDHFPKYWNAAVDLFNQSGSNSIDPDPALRLWGI